MSQTIYRGSPLALHAIPDLHLSFLDIDGTIASYSEQPSKAELEARREIREVLDKEGGVVFSTMRTPELCMSEDAFRKSQVAGFNRQEPHCHVDEHKKRCYKPLEELLKYTHNLDPHAISNVGTGIWIYKDGAYHPDLEFFSWYGVDNQQWKKNVMLLLENVDPDRALRSTFSDLEDPDNYNNGVVDVGPLECRFELKFKGSDYKEGVLWKEFVRQRLQASWRSGNPLAKVAGSIELVDESNPAKGRFQLYLVPRRHTKEAAFNHILRQVCSEVGTSPKHFTTLSAGDTMTDLKAGLFSGFNCRGYFVLAGGSRLTEYLIGSKKGEPFAGKSITSISRRLKPTGKKGWYTFYMYGMLTPRIVIIADEAVKGDKTDAESVLEVIKQFR